jgi:hypothetical protein
MRRTFITSLVLLVAISLLHFDSLGTPAGVLAQSQEPKDAPIDFQKARQLLKKRQGGEKLSAAEEAYLERAMEARKKRGGEAPASRIVPREKTGLKPLTEMTAEDRYQGQDGGLYGAGRNSPPEPHRQAALAAAARIQPLDAEGKPAADGRVVLVSISMSNATQEFSTFKRIADADPAKSGRLTIVDCAQGGQAMAEWVDPEAGPWREAKRRIAAANVTPQQVQVAWIKLANKGPRGDLNEHGKKLQQDTVAVIRNAKSTFPQLQIAYLGSRIYAGYAAGPLNPEPYAYESAFVVRWLIQDQIKGESSLNADSGKGPVVAPVLLWGPYFWGDGVVTRQADKLVWTREDLGPDGTHPSNSGREKVARMLLDFFKTDESAAPWFASAAGR